MDELVLAIPTAELWKLIPYQEQGFAKVDSDVLKQILHKGVYHERTVLEEDPSFKQLISYAIITYNDSFYLFRRRSAQTEQRLHNKRSLGVGGHMNPAISKDLTEQYLLDELKRELFEEVKLLNGCSVENIAFLGLINDDTIPVGRVHIGLLYIIRLTSQDVVINESDKMTADWVDKTQLLEYYDGMESWSRIAFDSYSRSVEF